MKHNILIEIVPLFYMIAFSIIIQTIQTIHMLTDFFFNP